MDSLLFLFHPASPGASGCSGSKGHDLGLRNCLFPLDEFDPREDVRVRLGDHLLHPGMPSFYVVVGSRLVLVEVVAVNRRKIPVDPGGTKVVHQLIYSRDVWGFLLYRKPCWSDVRQWEKCH